MGYKWGVLKNVPLTFSASRGLAAETLSLTHRGAEDLFWDSSSTAEHRPNDKPGSQTKDALANLPSPPKPTIGREVHGVRLAICSTSLFVAPDSKALPRTFRSSKGTPHSPPLSDCRTRAVSDELTIFQSGSDAQTGIARNRGNPVSEAGVMDSSLALTTPANRQTTAYPIPSASLRTTPVPGEHPSMLNGLSLNPEPPSMSPPITEPQAR